MARGDERLRQHEKAKTTVHGGQKTEKMMRRRTEDIIFIYTVFAVILSGETSSQALCLLFLNHKFMLFSTGQTRLRISFLSAPRQEVEAIWDNSALN